MKKTIITSVITTIATMFIVFTTVHLIHGSCGGQSKCGKESTKCSSSDYHCGGHGKCASFSKHCKGKKECSSKKSCKKGEKSCSSKSKCSKKKSCDKDKWTVTTEDGVTTKTYVSDDDEGKTIKKVIKIEVDEEEEK